MSLELPESVDATILPERRSPPRQPYPGLRPFDENEQRLFFGRDHQIKEILKRLQQTPGWLGQPDEPPPYPAAGITTSELPAVRQRATHLADRNLDADRS